MQALLIRMLFDIKANSVYQNGENLLGIHIVLIGGFADPLGALFVVCQVELFDSVQLIKYL